MKKLSLLNHIELFAGAGGMALGLEKAGFHHLILNEIDKNACNTLRKNRPQWRIIEDSIKNINWQYLNLPSVDLISGGFPCQAFSHIGKRLGLEDTRGTLFYDFANCIKYVSPTCFLAENVKGLISHDKGETLKIIINTFEQLNYHVFKPLLLNSNNYEVAQKRERLFLFGVKKEISEYFSFESPLLHTPISLRDIFFKGKYYENDLENMIDSSYSEEKLKYFKLIKPGQNWKSLPNDLQREYLGTMINSGGGKTGILKRLSYDYPSNTLLTSPTQKQTERCHPEHLRPLSIREYARIQSFPDNWIFSGSKSSQYKQIGNAVPVNLAMHVGENIANMLLKYKKLDL